MLPKHPVGRIDKTVLISNGATNKRHVKMYPAKFLSMEVKANFRKVPENWKLPKFREPGL